jgi:hypothetical protein
MSAPSIWPLLLEKQSFPSKSGMHESVPTLSMDGLPIFAAKFGIPKSDHLHYFTLSLDSIVPLVDHPTHRDFRLQVRKSTTLTR